MTPAAISARTRIPLDDVTAFLRELESPDVESRTPDADGRRIVRLDEHRSWGWHVVNYDRFRRIASEEQRREKTRERVRKFRKSNNLEPCNAPVTLGNAGNAMQREMQKQKQMEKGNGKSELTPSLRISKEDELHCARQRIEKLRSLRDQWTDKDRAESKMLRERVAVVLSELGRVI